ncbi:MAG: NFACT family protein [Clostridia bacterium]|nr:NFACT family protein [Clostridia bacterium]
MAFDAGILRAVLRDIESEALDGRIDRIYQPERDEVVFIMRAGGAEKRLLINAGSSSPRMSMTGIKVENPAVPPMFCMMLRKHFAGARLSSVSQPGFERVARLTFDCHDDMGFKTNKHIIAEIMGKYSNIIVTDRDDKILGVLKPIDFSASTIRQLLPGMRYTLPPAQDKLDPLTVTEEEFNAAARAADPTRSAVKFLTASFIGLAAVTAREIVYRSAHDVNATLEECADTLFAELKNMAECSDKGGDRPSMARNGDDLPIDYLYAELTQYKGAGEVTVFGTVSELIDEYYMKRAAEERLSRRASDIFRIISAAESRITKKLALQREELAKCELGETYKKYGDLITGSIYMMKKGMTSVTLSDWYSEGELIEIPLSERMTPAQNAQAYYKKYNKAKSAKVHLTEQIALAEEELKYLDSVFDSLTRASSERELSEIRAELYHSGYASKMKNYQEKKKQAPLVVKYETSDGHTVLCGKNNVANDHLTTKMANRSDWWFHVKNAPGSHVVLECFDGETDPSEEAFTEAAMIAAYNSSQRESASVAVDYTRVREVKKPAGSKPGFVIYHTNYTAYVTPEEDKIKKMMRS